MLVLSREPGTSLYVGSADETCVVTLLKLLPERGAVAVLVNRASAADPGRLDTWSVELGPTRRLLVGRAAALSLVDLRDGKARFCVEAPKGTAVHRLEVYEAILRDNRGRGPEFDEGPAGAPVPRPKSPEPPSLYVRLREPPAGDAE